MTGSNVDAPHHLHQLEVREQGLMTYTAATRAPGVDFSVPVADAVVTGLSIGQADSTNRSQHFVLTDNGDRSLHPFLAVQELSDDFYINVELVIPSLDILLARTDYIRFICDWENDY